MFILCCWNSGALVWQICQNSQNICQTPHTLRWSPSAESFPLWSHWHCLQCWSSPAPKPFSHWQSKVGSQLTIWFAHVHFNTPFESLDHRRSCGDQWVKDANIRCIRPQSNHIGWLIAMSTSKSPQVSGKISRIPVEYRLLILPCICVSLIFMALAISLAFWDATMSGSPTQQYLWSTTVSWKVPWHADTGSVQLDITWHDLFRLIPKFIYRLERKQDLPLHGGRLTCFLVSHGKSVDFEDMNP